MSVPPVLQALSLSSFLSLALSVALETTPLVEPVGHQESFSSLPLHLRILNQHTTEKMEPASVPRCVLAPVSSYLRGTIRGHVAARRSSPGTAGGTAAAPPDAELAAVLNRAMVAIGHAPSTPPLAGHLSDILGIIVDAVSAAPPASLLAGALSFTAFGNLAHVAAARHAAEGSPPPFHLFPRLATAAACGSTGSAPAPSSPYPVVSIQALSLNVLTCLYEGMFLGPATQPWTKPQRLQAHTTPAINLRSVLPVTSLPAPAKQKEGSILYRCEALRFWGRALAGQSGVTADDVKYLVKGLDAKEAAVRDAAVASLLIAFGRTAAIYPAIAAPSSDETGASSSALRGGRAPPMGGVRSASFIHSMSFASDQDASAAIAAVEQRLHQAIAASTQQLATQSPQSFTAALLTAQGGATLLIDHPAVGSAVGELSGCLALLGLAYGSSGAASDGFATVVASPAAGGGGSATGGGLVSSIWNVAAMGGAAIIGRATSTASGSFAGGGGTAAASSSAAVARMPTAVAMTPAQLRSYAEGAARYLTAAASADASVLDGLRAMVSSTLAVFFAQGGRGGRPVAVAVAMSPFHQMVATTAGPVSVARLLPSAVWLDAYQAWSAASVAMNDVVRQELLLECMQQNAVAPTAESPASPSTPATASSRTSSASQESASLLWQIAGAVLSNMTSVDAGLASRLLEWQLTAAASASVVVPAQEGHRRRYALALAGCVVLRSPEERARFLASTLDQSGGTRFLPPRAAGGLPVGGAYATTASIGRLMPPMLAAAVFFNMLHADPRRCSRIVVGTEYGLDLMRHLYGGLRGLPRSHPVTSDGGANAQMLAGTAQLALWATASLILATEPTIGFDANGQLLCDNILALVGIALESFETMTGSSVVNSPLEAITVSSLIKCLLLLDRWDFLATHAPSATIVLRGVADVLVAAAARPKSSSSSQGPNFPAATVNNNSQSEASAVVQDLRATMVLCLPRLDGTQHVAVALSIAIVRSRAQNSCKPALATSGGAAPQDLTSAWDVMLRSPTTVDGAVAKRHDIDRTTPGFDESNGLAAFPSTGVALSIVPVWDSELRSPLMLPSLGRREPVTAGSSHRIRQSFFIAPSETSAVCAAAFRCAVASLAHYFLTAADPQKIVADLFDLLDVSRDPTSSPLELAHRLGIYAKYVAMALTCCLTSAAASAVVRQINGSDEKNVRKCVPKQPGLSLETLTTLNREAFMRLAPLERAVEAVAELLGALRCITRQTPMELFATLENGQSGAAPLSAMRKAQLWLGAFVFGASLGDTLCFSMAPSIIGYAANVLRVACSDQSGSAAAAVAAASSANGGGTTGGQIASPAGRMALASQLYTSLFSVVRCMMVHAQQHKKQQLTLRASMSPEESQAANFAVAAVDAVVNALCGGLTSPDDTIPMAASFLTQRQPRGGSNNGDGGGLIPMLWASIRLAMASDDCVAANAPYGAMSTPAWALLSYLVRPLMGAAASCGGLSATSLGQMIDSRSSGVDGSRCIGVDHATAMGGRAVTEAVASSALFHARVANFSPLTMIDASYKQPIFSFGQHRDAALGADGTRAASGASKLDALFASVGGAVDPHAAAASQCLQFYDSQCNAGGGSSSTVWMMLFATLGPQSLLCLAWHWATGSPSVLAPPCRVGLSVGGPFAVRHANITAACRIICSIAAATGGGASAHHAESTAASVVAVASGGSSAWLLARLVTLINSFDSCHATGPLVAAFRHWTFPAASGEPHGQVGQLLIALLNAATPAAADVDEDDDVAAVHAGIAKEREAMAEDSLAQRGLNSGGGGASVGGSRRQGAAAVTMTASLTVKAAVFVALAALLKSDDAASSPSAVLTLVLGGSGQPPGVTASPLAALFAQASLSASSGVGGALAAASVLTALCRALNAHPAHGARAMDTQVWQFLQAYKDLHARCVVCALDDHLAHSVADLTSAAATLLVTLRHSGVARLVATVAHTTTITATAAAASGSSSAASAGASSFTAAAAASVSSEFAPTAGSIVCYMALVAAAHRHWETPTELSTHASAPSPPPPPAIIEAAQFAPAALFSGYGSAIVAARLAHLLRRPWWLTLLPAAAEDAAPGSAGGGGATPPSPTVIVIPRHHTALARDGRVLLGAVAHWFEVRGGLDLRQAGTVVYRAIPEADIAVVPLTIRTAFLPAVAIASAAHIAEAQRPSAAHPSPSLMDLSDQMMDLKAAAVLLGHLTVSPASSTGVATRSGPAAAQSLPSAAIRVVASAVLVAMERHLIVGGAVRDRLSEVNGLLSRALLSLVRVNDEDVVAATLSLAFRSGIDIDKVAWTLEAIVSALALSPVCVNPPSDRARLVPLRVLDELAPDAVLASSDCAVATSVLLVLTDLVRRWLPDAKQRARCAFSRDTSSEDRARAKVPVWLTLACLLGLALDEEEQVQEVFAALSDGNARCARWVTALATVLPEPYAAATGRILTGRVVRARPPGDGIPQSRFLISPKWAAVTIAAVVTSLAAAGQVAARPLLRAFFEGMVLGTDSERHQMPAGTAAAGRCFAATTGRVEPSTDNGWAADSPWIPFTMQQMARLGASPFGVELTDVLGGTFRWLAQQRSADVRTVLVDWASQGKADDVAVLRALSAAKSATVQSTISAAGSSSTAMMPRSGPRFAVSAAMFQSASHGEESSSAAAAATGNDGATATNGGAEE